MLGGMIGVGPGSNTAPGSQGSAPGNTGGGMGGGSDWGALAGALGSAYMGNQQSQQYGGALNSLNQLYSPTGPYATFMRQQLAAKDAAAGRNSQYGPREANLMAMLAQNQANTMTSPGYGNLMQQNLRGNQMGLNNLLALMGKGGPLNGMVNNVGNGISNGLSNLFGNGGGGGYSNNFDLGANAGPQLPDYSNPFTSNDWMGPG
jgi:hypothetical protein